VQSLTLKRAYADGTVAVEMDPLSLLCRLATSVPPPRFSSSSQRRSKSAALGRLAVMKSSRALLLVSLVAGCTDFSHSQGTRAADQTY
jgi:hypothetical protein